MLFYYLFFISMLDIKQWNVLAINSPSTSIEKIELPWWDPTSLYYAMVILNQIRQNTLWNLDFNSEIFNPKIWNSKVKKDLENILKSDTQKYALISNTTPSHPYALEISNFIKSINPKILIVLWWPHEDETMKWNNLVNWATLLDQKLWKISQAVDFVISWDWEYLLAKLLELLENTKWDDFKKQFIKLAKQWYFKDLSWIWSIGTFCDWDIFTTSITWRKLNMWNLPSIYEFFENNSYFNVFKFPNWKVKKTAHLMSSRWCIFNCIYCSESISSYWNTNVLGKNDFIQNVIHQIKTAINKWSQSAFFEDSIFMQWSKERILNLCEEIIKLQKKWEISNNFEWWCQLTVENILRFWDEAKGILWKMKSAWCSYIFYWIESLSEKIMKSIHKNGAFRNQFYSSWKEKVNKVLELSKNIWLKVWASILFWLPWENKKTIDYTINWIAKFVNEWKLDLISPNVVTYHPNTQLTKLDWMQDKIDYIQNYEMVEPYCFFEEASPWKISTRINETLMFYMKEQCDKLWALNKAKTISNYSNWVKEFYSENWWDLLIDSSNYPKEIIEFLNEEEQIIKTTLVMWWYDVLFEVWCMSARNLNISQELWIWYFWIDIVEKYIKEAEEKIKKLQISNADVKILSAYEVDYDNVTIEPSEKVLVVFPFNSFWNIDDIEQTLYKMKRLWYDLFISTYWTDKITNSVRYDYYTNCWYTWLKQKDEYNKITFISNEWLNTSVYEEEWLIDLLKKYWYFSIKVTDYKWIWKWYYIRV